MTLHERLLAGFTRLAIFDAFTQTAGIADPGRAAPNDFGRAR